jgi:hypothetical protein
MTLLAVLQGEFQNEDFLFLWIVVSLVILFLCGLFLLGIYIIYKSLNSKKEPHQNIFSLEKDDN